MVDLSRSSELPTAARRALEAKGPPFEAVAADAADIRCLALEGGGGKGMAYLGAIEALEELKVLKNLRVVAGASAGAITALLLALGMSASDIAHHLRGAQFDRFYDPPRPRFRPRVGRPYERVLTDSEVERDLRRYLLLTPTRSLPRYFLQIPTLRIWFSLAFGDQSITTFSTALAASREEREGLYEQLAKQPFKIFLDNLDDYLTYLPADMGLFSGKFARDEFDGLIRRRIRQTHPNIDAEQLAKAPAITFRDLTALFNDAPRLVLTGSNVSTGTTALFSDVHTPDFPVADAVRISMSLPFIFKPYVLTQKDRRGWPAPGTYVDGGWWNNLPYRDANYSASETLALRLEIVPPVRIATLGQLVNKAVEQGFFGTGESQVLSYYDANVVTLDIRPLSLFDFDPDPTDLKKVTRRSRRRIYFAFKKLPPQEDWDWPDDFESNRLATYNPAAERGQWSSGTWSSD